MSVNKEKYDVLKSIKMQEQYCKDKGLPLFVPANGICWNCHKNIYQPIIKKGTCLKLNNGNTIKTPDSYIGITTDNAGVFHITSCPHCNKSFCD